MDYTNLLINIQDQIALLTINSPKTLNSLNSQVLTELEAAFCELENDKSVLVVILTGAGDKAFVAGADIKEMASMDACQGHQFALKGQRLMRYIATMTKPVIAAVNGYALGGGLELALACDFIYASEKAKIGFPEVTLGIMPGFGGTQNLPRRIGSSRAAELIYSGTMINADKALAWGVFNEVFTHEELLDKTRTIASTIASVGSVGVGHAKNAMLNGLDMSKDDGFLYEAALFGVLFATDDQKEGMNAFVEKRGATFKGQ